MSAGHIRITYGVTALKQIIYDSESTGLDPNSGHRLVSVAAVEIDNLVPTGRFVHFFLNPERESDPRALEIHGLSSEFLSDKPKFAEIFDRLVKILTSAPLVIHNAQFDMRFLTSEFNRIGRPILTSYVLGYTNVCTLELAQRQYGRAKGRNTLDALTQRFGAPDLRAQTGKHGALIDCLQLVQVYRGLCGLKPLLDWDLSPFFGESNETERSTGGKQFPEIAQASPAAISGDAGQGSSGAQQVL